MVRVLAFQCNLSIFIDFLWLLTRQFLLVEKCLDGVQKHDEEYRRDRIEYAERLLERLKSGPQRLTSAFKLSRILSEQEAQRHERQHADQLE